MSERLLKENAKLRNELLKWSFRFEHLAEQKKSIEVQWQSFLSWSRQMKQEAGLAQEQLT